MLSTRPCKVGQGSGPWSAACSTPSLPRWLPLLMPQATASRAVAGYLEQLANKYAKDSEGSPIHKEVFRVLRQDM